MARYEIWAWRVLGRLKQATPQVSLWEFNSRDNTLRREGFLHWERFWLAQHAIDTPGMVYMRRERVRMSNQFGVKFENFNEWQREISQWYRKQNWFFNDGRLNPFKMLEDFKVESNSPDTPQPKAPAKTKDFTTAKEITEARQQRGTFDQKKWSKETRERQAKQQADAQKHLRNMGRLR